MLAYWVKETPHRINSEEHVIIFHWWLPASVTLFPCCIYRWSPFSWTISLRKSCLNCRNWLFLKQNYNLFYVKDSNILTVYWDASDRSIGDLSSRSIGSWWMKMEETMVGRGTPAPLYNTFQSIDSESRKCKLVFAPLVFRCSHLFTRVNRLHGLPGFVLTTAFLVMFRVSISK